jgi:signal transduction histidine kinase
MESSRPASPASVPGRILVVEDDPQIRDIVSLVLEDEGYEVDTASDGREALARLRGGLDPDLIVLDLMLPALDGWEFRAIQRAEPELATIPVLAVSADSSAKAAAIDATGFLRKPFRAADLLARVRKILEERVRLEARMAELERLVAAGMRAAEAAHELSSPLGSVMANAGAAGELAGRVRKILAELPRQQPRPGHAALVTEGQSAAEEMQETLRDLEVGTRRMSAALDDLRSLGRRGEEALRPIDLRAVIRSAIALTRHEVRGRAHLVVELDPGLPPVRGSEHRLVQLFSNLLTNAAHAIRKGELDLNEIIISANNDEDSVTVEVRDTGTGIPADVRPRLFEPFFTTKPFGQGTGLGLAICRSIAREHRGRIEVESVPGQGSVFRVKLPLDRAAEVAAPQPAPPPPRPTEGLPPPPLRIVSRARPAGQRPTPR